jgi:hypothetical protein
VSSVLTDSSVVSLEQRLHQIEATLMEVLAHCASTAKLLSDKNRKVTRKEASVFFSAKIEEIYFDHASFDADERKELESEGSDELRLAKGNVMQCDPPKLSSEAKLWIHTSLTPTVLTPPYLFYVFQIDPLT